MKTTFNRYFLKDLGKLKAADLKAEVAALVVAVEQAASLTDIPNVKKKAVKRPTAFGSATSGWASQS